MSWLDRVADQADALDAGARRSRSAAGPPRRARSSTRCSPTTADPHARADALVQRLSAVINLGGRRSTPGAVEEASDRRPRPRRALPARAPARAGRPRRAPPGRARPLRHPPGARPPGRWARWRTPTGTPRGAGTTSRWPTRTSLPRLRARRHRAGPAARQRRRDPRGDFAAPGIRLRNAVALDHNGDSDGCLRVLRDMAADLDRFLAQRQAPRTAAPEQPGRVRLRGRPAGGARRPAGRRPRTPPRPGCSATAATAPAPATCASSAGLPGHRRGPADRGRWPGWTPSRSPPRRSARPNRPGCAASRYARRRRPRGGAPGRPARVPARRPAQRPAPRRLRRRHRRPHRPRGDAPRGGPLRGRGADRPADRPAQPAPAGALRRRRGRPGASGR